MEPIAVGALGPGYHPSLWVNGDKGDGQWFRDGTLIVDRTRQGDGPMVRDATLILDGTRQGGWPPWYKMQPSFWIGPDRADGPMVRDATLV